jgi:glycosyltransferase involved in cell wall biosynthesis
MKKKRVEIVVPVYNEEKELEENIQKLYKFCSQNLKNYQWRITIADNASFDNTPIIASRLEKKLPQVCLFRIEEKGRGRAVKRAWARADADFYVYMDLDLSTDLIHLPRILAALGKGYDIAIGSRLAKGARVEGRTLVREIVSRVLNYFFIRFLFGVGLTDAQCGFKSATRYIVENLVPYVKDNDWFFDGEFLILAYKLGYKIYEEPIHWVDNPGSTVRLASTIFNDLAVMARLMLSRPWNTLPKRGKN